MGKSDFKKYLDDPNHPLSDQQDQVLAALMREIEEAPDDQPSQAYWNNFNQRLANRLQETQAATRLPWWRRLLQPMLLPTLVAAALLIAFWPQSAVQAVNLETLDDQQLEMLADYFQPFEEEVNYAALDNGGQDSLYELLDNDENFDIFEDHEALPSADELKEIWTQEG